MNNIFDTKDIIRLHVVSRANRVELRAVSCVEFAERAHESARARHVRPDVAFYVRVLVARKVRANVPPKPGARRKLQHDRILNLLPFFFSLRCLATNGSSSLWVLRPFLSPPSRVTLTSSTMAPSSLMERSGQTDAERRRLRQAQRSLAKSMMEQAEAMENPEDDAFAAHREQNNKLWGDVHYTREAVLDGENLQMISERAARQVDALVQVRGWRALLYENVLPRRERIS